MLKEDAYVDVKITQKSVLEHYTNLEYNCNMWETINVKQKDLTNGSRANVALICDYCGKEYTASNKSWRSNKSKQALKKDACCFECRSEYIKESNIFKYGKENVSQVDEFKEKAKQTNLDRYGVEYISQLKETQDKIKNTFIEKYGVDHYTKTDEYKECISNIWNNKTQEEIGEITKKREESCMIKYGVRNPNQSDEIKERAKETNIERYGCENVFQNEEVKQKIKEKNLALYGVEYSSQRKDISNKISKAWQDKSEDEIKNISSKRKITSLKRYGFDSPMKNKKVREKVKNTCLVKYGAENPMGSIEVRKKLTDTLNKNNLIATSKQQRYIQGLIGGTLNYYTGYNFLDIAFKEDNIYIEYDGGGHHLEVKLGGITQEEFDRKEMKRYFALKKDGWKCIKIISDKDKLPYDSIILKMICDCKELLEGEYNWVELNISNGILKTFDFEKNYDFGELRYIRKEVS